MSETIVAAAVLYREEVYSLPPPARHHDVLKHMKTVGVQGDLMRGEQGFLTSEGDFVRRKPAMLIAERAGQLKRRQGPGTYQGPELFSEDLW